MGQIWYASLGRYLPLVLIIINLFNPLIVNDCTSARMSFISKPRDPVQFVLWLKNHLNYLIILIIQHLHCCMLQFKLICFCHLCPLFCFMLLSAFLFSHQSLPACLSPCVSAGDGGGGCAGREYELPGRKAVFCLEGCCQHGEDGWGETGERWDWQLQPTFIHPFIHPPLPPPPFYVPSVSKRYKEIFATIFLPRKRMWHYVWGHEAT